jgi:glycogen operon protein
VIWRKHDGTVPAPAEWHDPAFRCLGVELRLAAEGSNGHRDTAPIFAVFNTGPEVALTLPDTAPRWRLILDTTRPEAAPALAKPGLTAPAQSVLVFTPDLGGAKS